MALTFVSRSTRSSVAVIMGTSIKYSSECLSMIRGVCYCQEKV
jgi:hypothetical protein